MKLLVYHRGTGLKPSRGVEEETVNTLKLLHCGGTMEFANYIGTIREKHVVQSSNISPPATEKTFEDGSCKIICCFIKRNLKNVL